MRLLVDSGVSDRVLSDGHEHRGIDLRFEGARHRVDFAGLVGASTWLYPQTDVFIDLADTRARDGGDVRYGVGGAAVIDADTDPVIRFVDDDGRDHEVSCDYVVGADGSRSVCRDLVPHRRQYFREYPFAWFGILAQAPPSHPELIYARSPHGFALISQRTATVQRMYFQCDPTTDVSEWSDDRIWAELQRRVDGGDGFALAEGRVLEKTVLPFRSFVQEPMRHGRLLLAGDAAHTVRPTGAKGLNLALADARVLAECLERAVRKDDPDALDEYPRRASSRVWKAQHFSYWMTTLLHRLPGGDEFDERRQLAELRSVVESVAGSTYLAEAYTGWPSTG